MPVPFSVLGGGSTFLWNIIELQDHMSSHSRRQNLQLPPYESQKDILFTSDKSWAGWASSESPVLTDKSNMKPTRAAQITTIL